MSPLEHISRVQSVRKEQPSKNFNFHGGFSSSNVAALKPNKKSFKKSPKPNTLPPPQNDKAKRSKPRSSQASQDDTNMDVLLTSTLIGIRETLASPVQTVAPKDPNAPLWDMLKKIPLPPDERMSVGMHLCKPEFAVHRGFLVNMGQEYLERWVYTYLSYLTIILLANVSAMILLVTLETKILLVTLAMILLLTLALSE
ncbi:hypothetical protein VPH35_064433 [Triticum aestivum]|uniref:Uncharacterized protein n=1 Tax=Triticum turgidum subsp. durum TaxID=4567 RepID=A0A9R0VTW7_TRITD|nr:unnamed protein product [Triticum turgidum subsp. durum]